MVPTANGDSATPRGQSNDIGALLHEAYETMEGSDVARKYSERHGVESASVLTVFDDETAYQVAAYLASRIEGKTVVEIGGGIGLLALHLGVYAKRVFCIEASPMWSSCFIAALYAHKPKNVSFLFGAADEFTGLIKADVALFCTHSGIRGMREAAGQFAPSVIDVYGELIAAEPSRFDALAVSLREALGERSSDVGTK